MIVIELKSWGIQSIVIISDRHITLLNWMNLRRYFKDQGSVLHLEYVCFAIFQISFAVVKNMQFLNLLTTAWFKSIQCHKPRIWDHPCLVLVQASAVIFLFPWVLCKLLETISCDSFCWDDRRLEYFWVHLNGLLEQSKMYNNFEGLRYGRHGNEFLKKKKWFFRKLRGYNKYSNESWWR